MKGVVVSGGVLVVEESQYQCAFVSGYNLASGALAWRVTTRFAGAPQLLGSSVVFEAQDPGEDSPTVRRVSLATGQELWRGTVMNGAGDLQIGAGSGVVALDQQVLGAATGRTRFTLSETSNASADTVTRGVVLATDGVAVRAADPASAASLWSVKAVAASAPQVHAGRVYIAAVPRTQVIDLASGAALPSMPGSDGSLALLGGRGFGATNLPGENGLVRAFSLKTGRIQWAYRVPAPSRGLNFVSMPVVAGSLVWVTTTAGTDNKLVALDAATGSPRSTLSLPCQPTAASVVPLDDRLLIPSTCGLLTATP